MERIWKRGSATIHAAPGAGKTRFTGATFLRMRAAGWAERMVVVVPNSALRSQWRESLFDMGISLDDEPRDSWQELRGTHGAVVTYHSLPNSAMAHQRELHQRTTLVVLDEVHHAGDKATWGRAVNHMVGDVTGEVHASGVLNLTGTLFRSTGSKQISTVQYRRSEIDPAKFEAIEDYSVKTSQLVPQYLRPPNVYTYGADVRLLDTSTAEIVEGEIADLDAQQKTAVLREQWSSKSWVDGFAAEALRLLQLQQEVVGRAEPLKLLYIAANQQAAKRAANTLNQLTRSNFARLVISDEPSADRVLRQAAKERTSLAIVSVRMVTEGFDCPAVSTIAYASNVIADLTIAQTMARAMRITNTERQLAKVLPAQILIPDHPRLKASFSEALIGRMHLINDEQEALAGVGPGVGGSGPTMPRYQVVDLTGPVLRGATVVGAPDGEVLADELAE
ncbi:MAG: DEAD/DEAH box helicase, partial [Pseudonocardiaceae bacterium]